MTLTLFRRKNGETSTANRGNSVYLALMNGLNEMKRHCVDRVVLALYEAKPSENAQGRWLVFEKDFAYYPFEMLDESEQKMILDGKTYAINALVASNIGEVVKYAGDGVESYRRTHLGHLMLPFVPKPESELNYQTEGGIHTGDNLRQFAEAAGKNGWGRELVEQRIRDGIQEYHEITRRLMKEAGVYDALEKMEKRQFTLFEQIMRKS